MARPSMDEAEKLKKVASFRLTEADYDAYQRKFAVSGLSQSEFFRRHVLSNTTTVIAKKAPRQPPPSLEKKRMLYLVNTVSNNVNQLARRVNTDHLADKLDAVKYDQVLYELASISDLLRKVLANVG